jgi:hypothetical protein
MPRLVHEALGTFHRDDAGCVLTAVLQEQQRRRISRLTGPLEMTPKMPHMMFASDLSSRRGTMPPELGIAVDPERLQLCNSPR